MTSPRALATALGLTLAAAARGVDPVPPAPVVCGPDIATLGDGWENAQLELLEMNRLLESGVLVKWPQRMAALVAHVRLIERRALPDPPPGFARVRLGVRLVAEREMASDRLALAEDAAALRGEFEQIRAAVQLIGQQLSKATLAPLTPLSHLFPAPPATLTAAIVGAPFKFDGTPERVVLRLATLEGKAVAPADVELAHGVSLHAYAVDETLADFQHEVAEPTGEPGEYAFTFKPARAGRYRMWLLATPAATQREELLALKVGDAANSAPPANLAPALISEATGLRGELRFAGEPPRVGEIATGKLTFTGADGKPVADLEPIFGQFAQLTAFPADASALQHIHPVGIALRADLRGGPAIDFRFRPAVVGPHRLFVEVRRAGEIRRLPFAFEVTPPAK